MVAVGACGEGRDPDAYGTLCGPATAQVGRTIDGDTIDLTNGTRVRYLLVDTPEIAHRFGDVDACFGRQAAQLNMALVQGRSVTLEYDARCEDPYGRTLAYVHVDGRMVNRVLVERGYAKVVVVPPNERYVDEFRTLQRDARNSAAGLWGACPP